MLGVNGLVGGFRDGVLEVMGLLGEASLLWNLSFILGNGLPSVDELVYGEENGVLEVLGLRKKFRGGEAESGLLDGDPVGGT